MSFDVAQIESIQNKLQKHLDVPFSSTGNLLRKSTLGLQTIHANIATTRKWSSSSSKNLDSNYFTNDDGFLETINGEKFHPLILCQYKIIQPIGVGSFSRIYLCTDSFSQNKLLALKLIRKGCELLARREKVILDHLSSISKGKPNPFIDLKSTLKFCNHDCLVFPYYSMSLMCFLIEKSNISESSNEELAREINRLDTSKIIQPRALKLSSGFRSSQSKSEQINPTLSPCDQHSSTNKRKTFSQEDLKQFKKISYSLLSALYILHQQGIIHADIKPENCYLDSISSPSTLDTDNLNRQEDFSSNFLSKITQMRTLSSVEYDVKLGDFGNSILPSEINQYYEEFEIQSLPYRAPEVLVGVPFNSSIDIWSLGIMLLELITGQLFLIVEDRLSAIKTLESKLQQFSKRTFSGGKFSYLLFESTSSSPYSSTNSIMNQRNDMIKALKRYISKTVLVEISDSDFNQLAEFLSKLLTIDPAHRYTAKSGLIHPFFRSLNILLPASIISAAFQSQEKESLSKRKLPSDKHIIFESLKRKHEPNKYDSSFPERRKIKQEC